MDTPPLNDPPVVPPTPPPSSGLSLNQWSVILHLSGLLSFSTPTGANIIGPLVVWLIKKTDLPAIDPVGKDVLNFQISYTIYLYVSIAIAVVSSCLIVTWALPAIVIIAWLVFTIIGAIKAGNGERYVFPWVIAFFK